MDKRLSSYIQTLSQKGVVIGPSDTCYGLFCNATCQEAVEKIFAIKKREKNKPLSFIVSDMRMAKQYISWNAEIGNIWEKYFPGPYTLILPRKKTNVIFGQGKDFCGIRNPQQPFLLEVSKKCNFPLIATSANLSNTPACYSLEEIKKYMDLSEVDFIDDQGKIPHTPPSTLIFFSKNGSLVEKKR